MTKKSSYGFTLIELVVVIIILGIIAIIAAPRFINLQHDSRAAAIKGVKATLASAAQLGHSYASVKGLQMEQWQAEASEDDKNRQYHFMYPAAQPEGLPLFVDIDTHPINGNDTSKGREFIWVNESDYRPGYTFPTSMYYTFTDLVTAAINPPYAKVEEVKATQCYAKYSIYVTADQTRSWVTTETFTTGC